jgi:beta-N-acetylhexosaminidase
LSFSNNFVQGGAEKALPCIFAVESLALSKGETSLFEQANPFGFILFKRNCDNPEQVKALVDALKESVGRDCPILIDQEGGRVARLKPPHWGEYKPMRFYGEMYERSGAESAKDSLHKDMKALAGELTALGINVDCAPVLDLLFDDAHDIIGDRSFSGDPSVVAELGAVVCETFLEAGVTPIIKHIPGHGRALADSHKELPHVKEADWNELMVLDFAPFAALSKGNLGAQVWAMSAHMTYEALGDALPMSLSTASINKVIRGAIGFDGVLICDDLDMKALDAYGASVAKKAVKALVAGCDLALYCDGKLKVMEELASELPRISDEALRRLRNVAGVNYMAV